MDRGFARPADASEDYSVPSVQCCRCQHTFLKSEYLFDCVHCTTRATCLECTVEFAKPADTDKGHVWHTCRVDSRDSRLTYVPGPSPVEFQGGIKQARQDQTFKFPASFKRLLSSETTNLKGFDKAHFQDESNYEGVHAAQVSATERRVDNNYSWYTPLDHERKQIRLAILQPGAWNDRIIVSLVATEYPWEIGSWTALSYHWGPLEETRRIYAGQSPSGLVGKGADTVHTLAHNTFYCTVNLEMALRTLRRRKRPLLLWVDALCINQGDAEDRAYQVGLMAEIYSRAGNVMVWTNLSTDEQEVVGFILAISAALDEYRRTCQQPGDSTEPTALLRDFVRKGTYRGPTRDVPQAEVLSRLEQFFTNTWFRRVWVLQEVCNGSQVAIFCGRAKSTAGSERLINLARWEKVLQANELYRMACQEFNHNLNMSMPHAWSILTASEDTSSFPSRGIKTILKLLLLVTRTFGASDPRDYVFALLNIAEDTSKMEHWPSLIAPNYRKTVRQVFADFTRWHMIHYKSLNVLGYSAKTVRRKVDADDDSTSYPSWAMAPTSLSIERGLIFSDEAQVHLRPSDTSKLDILLIENPTDSLTLSVRGFELDAALLVMNFQLTSEFSGHMDDLNLCHLDPTGKQHDNGLLLLWHVFWFSRVEKPNQCEEVMSSDNQTLICTCRRALDKVVDLLTIQAIRHAQCANENETKTGSETETDPEESRNIWYTKFLACWIYTNGAGVEEAMLLVCDHLRDLRTRAEAWLESRESRYQVWEEMIRPVCSRKVFISADSKLGLCPPETKPGDKIVSLLGAAVPVVLRLVGGEDGGGAKWHFIGECYVDEYCGYIYAESLVETGRESKIFDLI